MMGNCARVVIGGLSAVSIVLVALPSEAGAGAESELASLGHNAVDEREDVRPNACTPAEQCCQICTVGKACGKACIQASKICHKGRGCACNASEVCGN